MTDELNPIRLVISKQLFAIRNICHYFSAVEHPLGSLAMTSSLYCFFPCRSKLLVRFGVFWPGSYRSLSMSFSITVRTRRVGPCLGAVELPLLVRSGISFSFCLLCLGKQLFWPFQRRKFWTA